LEKVPEKVEKVVGESDPFEPEFESEAGTKVTKKRKQTESERDANRIIRQVCNSWVQLHCNILQIL
jgi:hypothetical protein